jgi:NAD(P)H-flavin reductase
MIEGPYGCLRPLRQFDSVTFFAGSTGATFTFPLLRDVLQGWTENTTVNAETKRLTFFSRQPGAVTRHMRFVWVVKSRGQIGWFSEQLSSVAAEFQALQDILRDIKLELTVYVTCDDSFTEEHKSLLSAVTAPTHNVVSRKSIEHGTIQYRTRTDREGELKTVEKQEIREVESPTTSDPDEARDTCGQDVACCCRAEVDENETQDSIAPCCCCTPSQKKATETQRTSVPSSQVSLSPSSSFKAKPLAQSDRQTLLHPSITVYTGRPKTKHIIRRSLEQALGESAVVVCGPQGLVADVKQDVCSLSDERAVHKGTGAQGIYLHTESFSY